MQAGNETSRNFLVRTDHLAARMGINVQDLPDVLGIGRASLFCCRTGKRPITPKTWLKLEEAERRAGVVAASETLVRSHAQAAEAAGGSEEQRQARFEAADAPRVALIEEINRLRDVVAELEAKLAAARKALE
jgi:hypothetical protein